MGVLSPFPNEGQGLPHGTLEVGAVVEVIVTGYHYDAVHRDIAGRSAHELCPARVPAWRAGDCSSGSYGRSGVC